MAPGWLTRRFSALAKLVALSKKNNKLLDVMGSNSDPAASPATTTTTTAAAAASEPITKHGDQREEDQKFNVQRIAIIGAGPSGLAAAKYLQAQGCFTHIQIFEQQPEVGGVWLYSATPTEARHIPQTDAHGKPDPPLSSGDGTLPPVFPSPVYSELHTNIPHTIMQFSDKPFASGPDDDVLIFPTRQTVHEYLLDYAADVRHLIRFSTTVLDVALRPIKDTGPDRWDVRTHDLVSGQETSATYDAVVVASGHYNVEYVPDVLRIRDFDAAHPGLLSHSRTYRTPDRYAGKRVMIVGNSASGLDIAMQIGRVCQRPLYVSAETPTPDEVRRDIAGGFDEVSVIEEFLPEVRGVRLRDGRTVTDLDAVVFCTGYLFAFSFLENDTFLDPPLVTDGRRVHGLYKHLIHIRHPTLVFPALPIKVIPFPLAETQAALFARLWANAMKLPRHADMEAWERREAERKGGAAANKFHVFDKGADGEYINEVHDWIVRETAGGGGGGKEPPRWNDEMLWQRGIYVEARRAFEEMGKKARGLGEIGFYYRAEGGVE